jgi:anti-sigma factor RsiW
MNCAQVKEQLVDFLYDELPAPLRASFAEHLQGCPGCRAEVASHQRALGHARAALTGPLMQEPPTRVHAAAIEAAQAASKLARKSAAREEGGFFARLWRTPWLLPAFGAASVATVVFLVRVLKNPEVIPGQRPQSVAESAKATPEPVAPSPLAAPAAPNQPMESTKQSAGRLAEVVSAAGAKGGHGMTARKATAPATEPPSPSPALVKKKSLANGPLDGLSLGEFESGRGGGSRFTQPPPPSPAPAARERSAEDRLDSVVDKKSEPRRAQAPAPTASGGKARQAISDDESLAMPESESAPVAAAEPAADSMDRLQRDEGVESATHAAAPSIPPRLLPRRPMEQMKEAAVGAEETRSEPMSQLAAAKDERVTKRDKAEPSLDESVHKAERLFASQDWNAAAAAYRDLLRRFPTYKDAPKWRERLNTSVLAEQERHKPQLLKAKAAAKAVSSDPLDGLKK